MVSLEFFLPAAVDSASNKLRTRNISWEGGGAKADKFSHYFV